MEEKYVVYENWRVRSKKAMVHKSSCKQANKDGKLGQKVEDNSLFKQNSPNDRWFGYFESFDSATAFAALLPNRQLKYCGHCLRREKVNI
jgi:hypothetical protein